MIGLTRRADRDSRGHGEFGKLAAMAADADPEETAVARLDAACSAFEERRFAEGLVMAREAAELFISLDGATSPDGANCLMAAADGLLERAAPGDFDEARQLYATAHDMLLAHERDAGGPLDTLTLRALRGVGTVACRQARYDDASTAFAPALEHAGQAFGPDSLEVATVCNDLGVLGKFAGRFDDAQRWYERALDIVTAAGELRSHFTATLHHNLAGLAHSRQRSADGVASGRLSVAIRRDLVGDDHVLVAADRANLGGLLLDVGAIDEAEEAFKAARAVFEREFGAAHPEVAIAWHNLAAVAAARHDVPLAITRYRHALAAKAQTLGADHPSTLITVVNLGYLVDDDREACALFQRAVDGLAGVVSESDRTLQAARKGLADRSRG